MITAVSSSKKREYENPGLKSVRRRFRSILVATDFTPASKTAVKLAAHFAKENHAKLVVLHSIMPDIYVLDMGPVPTLDKIDLKNARANLRKYSEHIPELRTVKHKEVVFLGSVSDAIQSFSETNHIDLLVLGSHGRHGLAKLALGSVAEWAIYNLKLSVLVAGPKCCKTWRPIRSLVLAADLSGERPASIQYATSIATAYNARLTFVHVVPRVRTADRKSVVIGKLHQLLPTKSEKPRALKFEVKTGQIAAAVLDSAQQNKANILVLSAGHKSFLADHAPRTTLSTIIRGARCPVLVVPSAPKPGLT